MTGDVMGHGRADIVVGNKKGTFLFVHEARTVGRDEWLRAQPAVRYPPSK